VAHTHPEVRVPPTLESLAVPIGGLVAYPGNPRRGRLDVLKASLARHGQYRPIVVNSRTMQVLAGNHTWRAAKELGWSDIAATFVDVDDDTAARIVLVDNRAPDLADNDDDELAALLSTLTSSEHGLDGTGFSTADFDELVRSLSDADDDGVDTSPQLGAVEYRVVILCEDEHEQAEVLERLQSEGHKCQAVSG
jgi:ParB-like chromosome segregation protein Spo0J